MLAMKEEQDARPLIEELKLVAGLQVKVAEPLARYTSMKIGGPADLFVDVLTEPALIRLLPLLDRHRTAFVLLGNGSNVLISDRGFRGAVLRLADDFKKIEWHEEASEIRVLAGAAAAVTQLVRQAVRRGYTDIEFAEGIPGSVGGALVMNAGAYGCEFEKVVDHVVGVARGGAAIRLTRTEMTFAYREAHLPAGMIVTRVALRLHKAEAARASSNVRELVTRRKSSQPSGYPNSGSMFRNPPGDFAGRLIEAAGLKGRRMGQSQISDRHANFIVNLGGAKASDVRRLMEVARSEVRRRFGVELVPEVKFIGEWSPGS
jgi:UDP-N-acetylmuramate dehydrogenase